jgi:hypothetical protein
MFAEACRKAMCYTKPLITNFVELGGRANAGNGSLLIINDEGWFVSAAHLFSPLVKQQADAPSVEKFLAETRRIEDDPALDSKQKKRHQSKLVRDTGWVAGTSFWWCPSIADQPSRSSTTFL